MFHNLRFKHPDGNDLEVFQYRDEEPWKARDEA
jgi:hypothetical protein